jgi:hypothetical protein
MDGKHKTLSPEALEHKEEITTRMYLGEIPPHPQGLLSTDEAARFTAERIEEARAEWERTLWQREEPDREVSRLRELTRRTALRWRYGTFIVVSFIVMIMIAGLSGHGTA